MYQGKLRKYWRGKEPFEYREKDKQVDEAFSDSKH